MTVTGFRRLAGILILIVASILLVWGLWPFGDVIREVRIFPEDIRLSIPQSSVESPQPAVHEERVLILELPEKIRTGDADIIRMALELGESSKMTATVVIPGQEVSGEPVQIPDLYDTHNVYAEARLDIAGVDYSPHGVIIEQMSPGVPVTFMWSVSPDEVGHYRGTIWLHLQFVPVGGGSPTRSLLSAQLVEFEAVNMFGLGGSPARVLGFLGGLVGIILGLDNVVRWSIKSLTRHLNTLFGKRFNN